MSASIAGSITLVKCSERSSGMGGGVLALRKKEESKDFIGWEG
jgi:gamma-glutamyltranspeptidase